MRPILQRATRINKTELAYQTEILVPLKLAGQILDFRYEAIKLRLADATFYTPDFLVVYPDRFEIHEIKGHWEDDARVKFKVAAEQYPWFRFKAIQRSRNSWAIMEVLND